MERVELVGQLLVAITIAPRRRTSPFIWLVHPYNLDVQYRTLRHRSRSTGISGHDHRNTQKAHIGVDADSGLVHTVIGTAANVHDVTQANALLHGQQSSAHGDAGYQGANKRPNARQDIGWYIAMRPGKRRALDKDNAIHAVSEKIEKLKASVRAKVEHPLRVIKRQFGHVRVRYRGLKKNTAQLHTLFALSNLSMVRGKLMAQQA